MSNNVAIKEKKLGKKFNPRTYTMIIALAVIWVVFFVLTQGNFLTTRNISNLIRQTSTTGLLAVGMLFVIVSGEIDLSVGAMMGLLGGVVAVLDVWFGFSPIVSIVLTLALGLVFGVWNGYWVAYKKVPSFIVTLAGMLVFRGVLIGMTKGTTIAPLSEGLQVFGKIYLPNIAGIMIVVLTIALAAVAILSGRKKKINNNIEVGSINSDILKIVLIGVLVGGIIVILNSYRGVPLPALIMVIIAGFLQFVSRKTIFGRRVYSIGGNIDAARLSGINVKKEKLKIFAMNGVLAACAGILLTSRLNAGSVSAGTNAELDAIASCYIGGTSATGGIGTVWGAVVGALVMSSIDNGMSMMNADPFWQYIVKGFILLIAVWIDMSNKNKA